MNGVAFPFFHNWKMAEPLNFLTLGALHHWHKQFWDHEVQWVINIIGAAELDFCFSVLQSITGFFHFSEGFSHLNKVTGKVQRDIQCYLVPVITDAVPSSTMLAI